MFCTVTKPDHDSANLGLRKQITIQRPKFCSTKNTEKKIYMYNLYNYVQAEPAVSSVAKRTLSVREVWGSIPGPVKSTQCRQRLAIVATLLRSCVAQALSRGDGPRNSLHASA